MTPRPVQGTVVTDSRTRAVELDAQDPLAAFRDKFARDQRDGRELIYLDGNSLGRLPLATARAASPRWCARSGATG